jgi:hypothetical protein
VKALAPEKKDNRYKRAAVVLIEEGTAIDLTKLAVKAGLTEPAAKYCKDAYLAITEALVEAKLMKPLAATAKAEPKAKAPAAPKKVEAEEPVPA